MRNVGIYYWLKKGYLRRERFWALKDVSLELHRGEALGVIGRNGAGKTTLLQLLAGIISPDRGELENAGVQAAMLSLQIGFLDQLSGRENAILGGLMLGISKSVVENKMEDIVSFSELGDFFDRPLGTYSSGMKARLGLSVALQLDPDVLLIDEVMGVGDAEFRAKSEACMIERVKSNRTIVLVSHNSHTIRQLCDRAVWIEKGRSLTEGPTEEVIQAYEASLRKEG
ncbi:MAG: ABC transporter ATP-binding protein [Acidobacteria bacterium]|nr:ABC transporter ATP-binding protein [Acidobacteriota bacterium]